MNIDKIVEAVNMGVAMAGGMPVVFPAIAVVRWHCMGSCRHEVFPRHARPHRRQYRGHGHGPWLRCARHGSQLRQRTSLALLMAAARLDLPTTFVSGGPMLAGHIDGHKTSPLQHVRGRGRLHRPAGLMRASPRVGVQGLSYLRILLGHVHCQLHELPHRGHWHGLARQRYHPCRVLPVVSSLQSMRAWPSWTCSRRASRHARS